MGGKSDGSVNPFKPMMLIGYSLKCSAPHWSNPFFLTSQSDAEHRSARMSPKLKWWVRPV